MCGRGDSIWEIPQDVAKQIVSWFPFLELITWQGGEVFLVDNFTKLFEKTFGFKTLKSDNHYQCLINYRGMGQKACYA